MARKNTQEVTNSPDVENTSAPDTAPVNDGTATSDIQIQGLTFSYTTPYVAGHPLTEGEANQLNGVRGENLRNNFASKIKDARAEAEKERGEGAELTEEVIAALQAEFSQRDAEYAFTGKRQSRGPVDPVMAKAKSMARETINSALRTKNIKPSDLAEGKMDELIGKYLENHPEVVEEARLQVQKVKEAAADALGGVDLGSLTSTTAPTEAPPAEAAV